jgi:hypothetical protein
MYDLDRVRALDFATRLQLQDIRSGEQVVALAEKYLSFLAKEKSLPETSSSDRDISQQPLLDPK